MRGPRFKQRAQERPRAILPNSYVADFVDSPLNPLCVNPVIGIEPGKLAIEEYHRCLDIYEARVGLSPMSDDELQKMLLGIFMEIISLEAPITDELEALAVKTIKELYQTPDELQFEAEITHGPLSDDLADQSIDVDISLDRIEYIEEEIQKRVLLNSLVHGSSKHAWKTLHFLVADEINALNPRLMRLYGIFIGLTSASLWRQNKFLMENVQLFRKLGAMGINQVKCDDEGATLESEAICFPILLCELNKSLFDYTICSGIPGDLTEDEILYYYQKADDYAMEPWHYMLGPSLWEKLITAAHQDNKDLPEMMARISELTMSQLTQLFQYLLDDQPEETVRVLKENNIL